jgi:formate hydrogenlyase transcriptional activator
VPLLVQFLVGKFGARVGRRIEAIEQTTMERLISYHWPGNVRELENILERALILSNGSTLEIDPEVFSTTPKDSMPGPNPVPPLGNLQAGDSMESIERNHILAVLAQTHWIVEGPSGAARILELHPNTLRSRMKKLGIRRAE